MDDLDGSHGGGSSERGLMRGMSSWWLEVSKMQSLCLGLLSYSQAEMPVRGFVSHSGGGGLQLRSLEW